MFIWPWKAKVENQYVKEKGLGMTSKMRLPISSRCLIVSFLMWTRRCGGVYLGAHSYISYLKSI